MKNLFILIFAVAVSACATGYHPTYSFNEVQVHNLSGAAIHDVKLHIVDSPKTLSCAEIAKNAMCYDLFGRRDYPGRGIELGWTLPDGSRLAETLNPRIPAYFGSTFPLQIIMEIREDGSVRPVYRQNEPGGRRCHVFGC